MPVIAPPPRDEATVPAPRLGRTVGSALLLPLFFVILFPLVFVSALHRPTPHNLPLLVVGPDQVVGQISTVLDGSAQFAATHTDVASEARSAVADRSVDGAIEVTQEGSTGSPTYVVTTYVAGAGGRAAASAVEGVGVQVAAQLNTSSKVIDVAPLVAKDELGTTLFYLLAYTTLGAYLVIVTLMQVMPDAPLRTRYRATAIAAVAAPVVVFGLSAFWVGDYGAGSGTIAALLGVSALYVFTVGAAAILIEQFLGKAATFGIMLFLVFLNFPSAGGASSAAMLPPFWQFVHSFYFGAGAFESFRSIVYFDLHGAGRWLLQLCAWTAGLILTTVVVHLTKTARRLKLEVAGLTSAVAHMAARSAQEPNLAPTMSAGAYRSSVHPIAADSAHDEEHGSSAVVEGVSR